MPNLQIIDWRVMLLVAWLSLWLLTDNAFKALVYAAIFSVVVVVLSALREAVGR